MPLSVAHNVAHIVVGPTNCDGAPSPSRWSRAEPPHGGIPRAIGCEPKTHSARPQTRGLDKYKRGSL
ncbi:MAG: hypothetical protein A2538_03565 [Candidatus Magasanikbacteria bacterium RIFOXYD2_FULL_41_14]|uniref:Uncharacterized protein n=1 Tax=Candidatus Magasanikbacteria bacterium RIFOXYD2_FULL_41_14 TaxID=1798709 RepID=A0A1F6PCP0_9BACT|nr:MAG: hypothetical protein A2538_03565 [Candidatus Magasanikbacteria bacterium RIFOXYD2_FULL_41_14]